MALTWQLPYSNCWDIFALARWRLFRRRTWTLWRPFGKKIAMESLDSSSSARFGDKCAVSSTSLQRRFPGSQRLGTSDSWWCICVFMTLPIAPSPCRSLHKPRFVLVFCFIEFGLRTPGRIGIGQMSSSTMWKLQSDICHWPIASEVRRPLGNMIWRVTNGFK